MIGGSVGQYSRPAIHNEADIYLTPKGIRFARMSLSREGWRGNVPDGGTKVTGPITPDKGGNHHWVSL